MPPFMSVLQPSQEESQVESMGGCWMKEAIRNGSFPTLEQLHVSFNHALGDGVVMAVMAGLEGGGCPHLKNPLGDKGRHEPTQGSQALA